MIAKGLSVDESAEKLENYFFENSLKYEKISNVFVFNDINIWIYTKNSITIQIQKSDTEQINFVFDDIFAVIEFLKIFKNIKSVTTCCYIRNEIEL